VRYWDLDSGKELRRFEGHSGLVYSAVLSGDGRRVLSAGWDGTLRFWNVDTGQLLRLIEERNCPIRLLGLIEERSRPIRCIALAHDDRRVLAGGVDRLGRVWDLNSGTEWLRLPGHSGEIWHVAISPDDALGLTARNNSDRRFSGPPKSMPRFASRQSESSRA
jgi:WD40 repeat protein